MADESRLQQVVWNLLTNAIKFTPAGGRIDVNARADGDQYEIAVTDSGSGISPEFLPQIFERFSQQESGTGKSFAGPRHRPDHRQAPGRHPSRNHRRWRAKASARARRSACGCRSPTSARARCRRTRATRLRKIRILVVEDDPDARALIVRILTDAGAQVSDVAERRRRDGAHQG